jgi:predicted lactoylglutathione lyase
MSDVRISMVTLGVSDLEQSQKFYEALGWQNIGHSQDSVKFLQGNNIVLGLYGRDALAKDIGAETGKARFSGISLAVNLASESAVNDFFQRAIDAGAAAQKPPGKAFWGGYSSYLRDPDGHYWEVAHNPYFALDENGNLQLGAKT